MRIAITARKFRLSEELKTYAEKEVYRLKKYYEGIINVDVILSWEKKERLAEVNMSVFGTRLSAHEHSEDMRKSIDGAVEKMERQLIKYKERLKDFDHEKLVHLPQDEDE